ncbi:hypothetical protein V7127_17505 [Bacillus sp. JJ1773]|uniref:hypothetical protein n=1 Tax=Bacillus sp. JJ1773 TaxID=3122965 RepID=UPI002FFFD67E
MPKRLVTASEIDQMIGAEGGWSENKSGVKQRHFVEDETASFMGEEAAKLALQDARMSFPKLRGAIQDIEYTFFYNKHLPLKS